MNLRGVTAGDVVMLKGDPSLWIVTGREGRRLMLRIPRGAGATHHATAHEVEAAWRKVKRG